MSNENVANTAVEEVSGGFTGGYITGGGERKTLWQKIFGTRSEREIKRIDGIKEKVLAAYRAGIRKILLPRDNERDIEEIPLSIRKQIEFVLLSKAEDALDHVFADPKKIRRKNGSKKS